MQLKTWLIFTLCLSCLEFCSVIKIHGVYTWRCYFSGGKRQGRKATETHHSVQLLMCSIRQFGFSSVRLMGAVLRQGNKGSLLAGQRPLILEKRQVTHKGAGHAVLLPPSYPCHLTHAANVIKRSWRDVEVLSQSSGVQLWHFGVFHLKYS